MKTNNIQVLTSNALNIPSEDRIWMEAKVKEIAENLSRNEQSELVPEDGLMRGKAGVLLFYVYAYMWDNESNYSDQINLYLGQIFQNLNQISTFDFSSGFGGVAWVLAHLKNQETIELELDDLLEKLDHLLRDALVENVKIQNNDLISGALGLAMYFLERDTPFAREVLSAYIKSLHQETEDNTVCRWKTIFGKGDTTDVEYDLGICHGNAGILSFLLKAYQQGIETTYCKELIDGSIEFFMSVQQTPKKNADTYWASIVTDSCTEGNSRLSWCYGDLGIATTLLEVGNVFGNQDLVDNMIEVLLHSTKKRDPSDNNINDACICHGTIGLMLLYLKAYRFSGNSELEETALYWIQETRKLDIEHDGSCKLWFNYVEENGKSEYRFTPGVLEGMAGIGLGMLMQFDEDLKGWEKILLV